jgi:hypothetical protein
MPTTVVLTSSATVAMDTFMTELSNVIRNWADASVTSTVVDTSAERSTVTAIGAACHTAGGSIGIHGDVPSPNPRSGAHATGPRGQREPQLSGRRSRCALSGRGVASVSREVPAVERSAR